MLWLPWLPHAYWYWAEHCGTRPIVKHTRGSFCIFSLRSNTNWANRAHRVFSLSMVFVKKDLWKHHGWWDSPTPANGKWRFFCFSFFSLSKSFLFSKEYIRFTQKNPQSLAHMLTRFSVTQCFVFKKLILWQIIMFCPDFLRRTEKRWSRWGDSTRYFIIILWYLIPINPQEILNVEGGPNESMSIMYGTLLRKYEAIKDDFGLVSKRWYF